MNETNYGLQFKLSEGDLDLVLDVTSDSVFSIALKAFEKAEEGPVLDMEMVLALDDDVYDRRGTKSKLNLRDKLAVHAHQHSRNFIA